MESIKPKAIDISSNNHNGHPFNWQQAYADGYTVAYVKATQGGIANADGYLNPYLIADCRDAVNAGFMVGIYHYLTLTSTPQQQAAWFAANGIAQVAQYTELIPMLDYEKGEPNATLRDEFLFALGHECGVYMDRSFYGAIGLGTHARCGWLAWPGWSGEAVDIEIAMVQTGSVQVPGIGITDDGAGKVTDINTVLDLEILQMSATEKTLNAPIVGGALVPKGGGYWLVGADGGVFCFGSAQFYGSMGGKSLQRPIVSMFATETSEGYCLVGADGGVFAFGDAVEVGSVPGDGIGPAA